MISFVLYKVLSQRCIYTILDKTKQKGLWSLIKNKNNQTKQSDNWIKHMQDKNMHTQNISYLQAL